jgi:hypothetical protein
MVSLLLGPYIHYALYVLIIYEIYFHYEYLLELCHFMYIVETYSVIGYISQPEVRIYIMVYKKVAARNP